jgi:hypothetical protein
MAIYNLYKLKEYRNVKRDLAMKGKPLGSVSNHG